MSLRVSMFAVSCIGMGLVWVAADRMRADDPPADDAPAESAADLVADWDELVARMREIETRVTQIREEFPNADAAGQDELRAEFNLLLTELNNEIYTELAEQAGPRLEASPDDLVAAEIVMQQAFNANQFGRAAELADQILAETPDNSAALNFGGVAHYAIHDFETAHELLQTAQANGSLRDVLERTDGSPFQVAAILGSSEDYIEYWEEEQAIREQEAAAEGDDQLPRVKLVTTRGEIILELFENEAPNTVANFISLVEEGYYDELKFHRIIQWFMAQGGCPNTRPGAEGFPGGGGPGYNIECESHAENARRHFAGTLSMAHAGRDTGGSQFFITHLPTPHLDLPVNPNAHTVFGRVVEGMDVVAELQIGDMIESAEVIRKRDHAYEPMTIAPARN